MVRPAVLELLEEDFVQFVVVVLPGVHEDVARLAIQFGDDARELDDLRARADDRHHLGPRGGARHGHYLNSSSASDWRASGAINPCSRRSLTVARKLMTLSAEQYSLRSAFASRLPPPSSGS